MDTEGHDVTSAERGFAARSGRDGPALARMLADLGVPASDVVAHGGVEIATWGMPVWRPRLGSALLLCAGCRRHETDLTAGDVAALPVDDPSALGTILPTFGAVAATSAGGVVAATDRLGFRQLFYGSGPSGAVVSTSSRAVALETGARLDHEAVAVQSQLGWQLGTRTLFTGVTKLGPGERVGLDDAGVVLARDADAGERARIGLDEAVARAARLLTTYLTAYLEDHPDAGLQLTGGQDSRLLLSAIPKARRKGLRVVTLGARGDPDVDLAASFARRYGMEHELLSLDGLDDLEPAEAYERCLAAARAVDYVTDPLARAALDHAEFGSRPGPRISGLGGEVARGFYYLGPSGDRAVTLRRARQLARWRMFVNEAVPVEALDPEFAPWAREVALREVTRALTETGRPWLEATDALYLGHRMQRWAGATQTASSMARSVVNPMLDDRFLAIAEALAPRDKRASRFLSRLQLALDPELGAVPLEGRPAPAAYARRSVANSARQAASTAGKMRRKATQRLRRETRPPAGGAVLAGKVAEHWRTHPDLLEPVAPLGVFDPDWLGAIVAGEHEPAPSAVALLVDLLAAAGQRTGAALSDADGAPARTA